MCSASRKQRGTSGIDHSLERTMALFNHRLAYRPLRGGVEIYNPSVNELGTLGFIAADAQGGAGLWIVSCYHVLVGGPGRAPVAGEDVFQPSDGTAVAGVDAN